MEEGPYLKRITSFFSNYEPFFENCISDGFKEFSSDDFNNLISLVNKYQESYLEPMKVLYFELFQKLLGYECTNVADLPDMDIKNTVIKLENNVVELKNNVKIFITVHDYFRDDIVRLFPGYLS
jgi:hypothetical protein